MSRNAQSIDAVVGARVRDRRDQLGMTQSDLGARCGVTFQQIQKYERGANRISCSRLVAIAAALDAPATHFLEGLDAEQVAAPEQIALPSRLIRAVPHLSTKALGALADLAVALADPKPEAA